MIVAVPKEREAGEARVALVPAMVPEVARLGAEVYIEAGAGEAAHFSDQAYEEAGARIVADAAELRAAADILLRVAKPQEAELAGLREGAVLIGFLDPLRELDLVRELARRKVTSFGMEMIPRTTRAQRMDALSSQSTVAGYKAVLLAANELGKLFPLMMTAAGNLPPARVLVLGAGVAGLQAIATARRLGAVVEAFDIRPATKEQVESLGARFIQVEMEEETETEGGYAKEVSEEFQRKERELIHDHCAASDVVITTALVPGRPAPVLITEDMVRDMKEGSVIVDLAAPNGGNCELTEPGKRVVRHGVTLLGPLNIPGLVPVHASQMYSRNVVSLLQLLIKEGELNLDFEDDIIRDTCLTHAGEVRNERVKELLSKGDAS